MREVESLALKRAEYTDGGFKVEPAMVGMLPIMYVVVPQTIIPSLPDFAMSATHQALGDHEVMVFLSESIPVHLRQYAAGHEIVEAQIGNTQGSCTTAEQIVLAAMPDNLRSEFVKIRVAFFTNLIAYYQQEIDAGSNDYTQDDITEAEQTRQMLVIVERSYGIDWPLVKKSIDRATIEKEVEEGIAIKGSIFGFVNNFETRLPNDEMEYRMSEDPDYFTDKHPGSGRADDKIYHSDQFIAQTYKQFLEAVAQAIKEEGIDTVELERLRQEWRNAPRNEHDQAKKERYLRFALPVYKGLRRAGYSHYDLWS